jgi:hypothetical protein
MLVVMVVIVRVALGLGRNSGQCTAALPNRHVLIPIKLEMAKSIRWHSTRAKLNDHS